MTQGFRRTWTRAVGPTALLEKYTDGVGGDWARGEDP